MEVEKLLMPGLFDLGLGICRISREDGYMVGVDDDIVNISGPFFRICNFCRIDDTCNSSLRRRMAI